MPLFEKIIKYIEFHNNTNLPVNIGSWVDGSNTMRFIVIYPDECVTLHSSVGEWHLDSMFNDVKHSKSWSDAGLGKHTIVGKFRSSPCASGNYSWMEYYEPFDCIYTEDKSKEVKGLITFLRNP